MSFILVLAPPLMLGILDRCQRLVARPKAVCHCISYGASWPLSLLPLNCRPCSVVTYPLLLRDFPLLYLPLLASGGSRDPDSLNKKR